MTVSQPALAGVGRAQRDSRVAAMMGLLKPIEEPARRRPDVRALVLLALAPAALVAVVVWLVITAGR